jgi:hypothetical protein
MEADEELTGCAMIRCALNRTASIPIEDLNAENDE